MLRYAATMLAALGVCGSYLVYIAANVESLSPSSSSQPPDENDAAIGATSATSTTILVPALPRVAILLVVGTQSRSEAIRFASSSLASLLGGIARCTGHVRVIINSVRNLIYPQWRQQCRYARERLQTLPLALSGMDRRRQR